MVPLALLTLIQVCLYWIASGEMVCYYRKRIDDRSFVFRKGSCDYGGDPNTLASMQNEEVMEVIHRASSNTTVITALLPSLNETPSANVSFTNNTPTNGRCTLNRSTVLTSTLATNVRGTTAGISSPEETKDSTAIDQEETTVNPQTSHQITEHTTIPTTDQEQSGIVPAATANHNIKTGEDDMETFTRTAEEVAANNVCDTWTVFESSCYFLDTRSRTWAEAAELCRLHHPKAHLVIIDSDSENTFVASLVGDSTPWIALTDEDIEGQWRWFNQGVSTSVTFTNWDSDFRNNGNRNCAYIRGYNSRWQTYWCSDGERFVCEVEL